MGQTLSEPVTEKHTRSGKSAKFSYALSEMQGWRVSMEDAHTAILEFEEDKEASFFAVFDGHGGVGVARYAGANCHNRIIRDPEFSKGNYHAALKNGFLGIDEDIQKDPNFVNETSGCTAVTLLITKEGVMYCANAGDSRCVISSAGVAIPLSFDHKPSNREEIDRITEAGGFVHFGRVNGNLALSRAFGDFEFKRNPHLPPEKQIVTANPEIHDRQISPEDEFIVLACDGIWDVLSNQQVVDFVRSKIAKGFKLEQICEMVLDRCLARDPGNAIGCDNMTIVIVAILNGQTEEAWAEKCKKVAIVDGHEVDPLQLEDVDRLKSSPSDDSDDFDFEDPEQKYNF